MPIKNNRNSRDDKSKKVPNSTRSSSDDASKTRKKPERTDASNSHTGKLFGERGEKPFKKTDGRIPRRPGKDLDRSSDGPAERRFTKPDDRKTGDTIPRKTWTKSSDISKDERPVRERKNFDKPSGNFKDKKFTRSDDRKLGDPAKRKTWSKSSDTSKDERPVRERKNFDKPSDNFRDKKFGRSDDRKPGDPISRKPWSKSSDTSKDERPPSRYGRLDTGKPFKKEYKAKPSHPSGDREWSSGERIQTKSPGRSRKSEEKSPDGLIRLNRYIANAGICSRRKADELIQAGVVSVNGVVVSELGSKIDPVKDVIRYNGETLKREKMVYVLLNKPKDYITTTDDPHERRTVMQLVEKASRERIYPVGRLDRNTTGLLLMTNDGALAEKLSHPRNNVTKIYNIELNKNLSQGDLNKITFGLELEDGLIKPDAVSYVQGGSKNEIGMQIHSGKNHIVRRIFEHLGYEVIKLDRVVYGNLTKKDLTRGRWRYLDEKEIIQLKHLIK